MIVTRNGYSINRFNQASKWSTRIEIYRIIIEFFFIDKFERSKSFSFKYLIWNFFYTIFILSVSHWRYFRVSFNFISNIVENLFPEKCKIQNFQSWKTFMNITFYCTLCDEILNIFILSRMLTVISATKSNIITINTFSNVFLRVFRFLRCLFPFPECTKAKARNN